MKIKFIESIILKSVFLVSLLGFANISQTNALFGSSVNYEQNSVSAAYWVKPKVNFVKDENNYRYSSSDTIKVSWETETNDSQKNLRYTLLVKLDSADKFEQFSKPMTSYQNITFDDIKEVFKLGSADVVSFTFKIAVIDSHDLSDNAISAKYTFTSDKDDDTSNNNNDDHNQSQLSINSIALPASSTAPAVEPVVTPTPIPEVTVAQPQTAAEIIPTPTNTESNLTTEENPIPASPEITEQSTQSAGQQ